MRKLQRALITTTFDAVAEGSGKSDWALVRWAKADSFGCASQAGIPAPIQAITVGDSKKADSYWCAPPDGKMPTISITKIAYVRTSELTAN